MRSLVRLHGGTVEARSDGLGKGSEFVVRLPLLETGDIRDDEPVTARPVSRAGRPQCRRVLVVDDNRDSANSLALLLKVTGHEVQTAHTGPAALEGARGFQPEVVLLDIGLPGMNGYEVARELRKEPGLQGVVLVAMTGYGQEENRRRSCEAGFQAHLVKPLDPAVLKELLDHPGAM